MVAAREEGAGTVNNLKAWHLMLIHDDREIMMLKQARSRTGQIGLSFVIADPFERYALRRGRRCRAYAERSRVPPPLVAATRVSLCMQAVSERDVDLYTS